MGRDQYRFYSHELGAAVAERIHLERDLRAALGRGEFELHYQPKIHTNNRIVAGVEALLRWNRPPAMAWYRRCSSFRWRSRPALSCLSANG
jgi:predicted signal transduction protein with EAL and GGDEF domain